MAKRRQTQVRARRFGVDTDPSDSPEFSQDIETRDQREDVVEASLPDGPPHREAPETRDPVPNDDVPEWAQPTSPLDRSRPLGQALLARGLVDAETLDRALTLQRSTGHRVGETLVDSGVLTRTELTRALGEHLGIPFVDLERCAPDPVLTAMIPEESARRYRALAVERWERQILVAMADPNDVFALDDLRVLTHHEVVPAIADPDQLESQINRVYHRSEIESSVEDASADFTDAQYDDSDGGAQVDDGPVVRLANVLLDQAITDRASDLHIEPASAHVRVRLRIDGVLHDASELPLNVLRPLVSRLKVVAGLDIAQSRVAQDGRFTLNASGRRVDVRIATIPTAAGESVVLRLLDPVRGTMKLRSLGLSADEEARLLPAFLAPQGSVFVTGPTGSGKTSTLYAFLTEVNSVAKSVVSVEDPVEYRVDGIKQIQINPRAGVTFPSALRSVLRADPDVIFIGEVRDAETARIAADAAVTGHLVLSTLHTTRAAAAAIRLADMGVEPYLIAASLSCVASQRLARRLCDNCAQVLEHPDLASLRELGADDEVLEHAQIRHAAGCQACRKTGYHGRVPLFEIMPVTEEIARAIVERASSHDIEQLAIEQGMQTMRQTALRRVMHGELSVDEMLRVVS
jgi:type IV pilus assembly protein PilB